MKTRKYLLELLKDPQSDLSIALKELDAEEGVENLEMKCLEISRQFGLCMLTQAVQKRAEKKPPPTVKCPCCAPKVPSRKGEGFPPSASGSEGETNPKT